MSLTEIDKALGYVAVHQRVLSQGQLQQAMSALQRNPASQGLGPLLVQHGYLTPQRLNALMSLVQRRMGAAPAPMSTGSFGMPPPPPRPTPSPAGFNPLGANQAPVFNRQIRSMQSGKFRLDDVNPQGRAIPQQGTSEHQKLREQYEEYVFSQLLMKQGMVSEQQLRGVFQRKGNFQQGAMSLGRQLIAEGLLNPQLVADITADLQKKIFACPSCGNCYYVEPTAQAQRFPCRRCSSQVEVPPIGGAPSPMGSFNGGGNPMNGSRAPAMPPQPGVSGSMAGSYGSNVNGSFAGASNNGFGAAPGFSPSPAPNSSGFMAPAPPPSTGSFGAMPGPSASPAPAPSFGMNPSPGGGGFGAGPGAADFDPGTPMGDASPGGDSCPESFGDYDIEREIARGGMGVVYLATKRETGEKCALKVMLESVSQNPKRLKRFQREIDAHRKLIHDNIVRILDAGKVDEFYFFTMEYVDGKPLDDRLKEELDLEIVMEILEKICRATDYAHSEGVVHRDLKPANILVTSKMVPKLTDFGLAKTADHVSVLTKTGAVVGTPYYLSPEQASGQSKDVDKRADVYALGVMMYEMITGRLPFTGKTSVELFRKIIHEDPIPPIKIKPQLTEEIQRVCLKALEKQPNDRYQSAGMLAQDIRCLIEGKPISARKPSMIKQSIRRIRKKGAAPVFMAAGVFLVLLVGAGFTWHLIQSRQQAYADEVAAEWDGYQSALDSDRETVLAALEDAAQKTRKEQGHDALDAVNRAIIYLALMEYRGGFTDKGNKILRDAGGDFAEILSFITNGRTSDAQSKLTLFGVDLEKWPEPLVNEENVKRALKEAEGDEEKSARRDLLARIFVARGYAKVVLNEQRALDDARVDFERVEKFIDTSGSLAPVALGDLYVAEGKLGKAIQQYGTAIFTDKEAVGAYLGKAKAYFLQEQYRIAHDTLEEAVKVEGIKDSDRGELLAARAYATVKLGYPTRAIEDAKKACELAPDSFRTWLSQAIVLSELGDHIGADAPFEKAKALAAKEEAPDVLIAKTKYLLKRRLYKEALAEANEAKRLADWSLEALYTRALVHEHLLEEQKAKVDAENAKARCQARHWQSKAKILTVLARIHATSGELNKAIRLAKDASSTWPESSECRLLHGYLLLSQSSDTGKLDEASRLAVDIIKKGTDTIGGKRLHGLVTEVSKDDLGRAQSKLREVLRLGDPDARVLTVLAGLCAKNESDRKEVNKIRSDALLVERDVSTIEGDYLARAMGIISRPLVPKNKDKEDLEAGKQIKKARATFEKTLFHNPQNVHALTVLGQLALARADVDIAKEFLESACRLNPLHAPAFLARLDINSGNRGELSSVAPSAVEKDLRALKDLLQVGGDTVPTMIRAAAEIKFREKGGKATPADFEEIISQYDLMLRFEPGNMLLLDRKEKLLNEYRRSLKDKGKIDAVSSRTEEVQTLMKKIKSSRSALYENLKGPLKNLREGSARSADEFWQGVRTCPRFFVPWECLARAAILNKDFETGVAALAQLCNLSPSHSDLYPLLLQVAKEKGSFQADTTILKVKSLLKKKAGITADHFLSNTIAAIVNTCDVVANSGSPDSAESAIRKALKERPLLPLLHGLDAEVLKSKNKLYQARKALELAHTICEGKPNISLELARMHKLLAEKDKAKKGPKLRGDRDMILRLLSAAKKTRGKADPQWATEFATLKKEAPTHWKAYELP